MVDLSLSFSFMIFEYTLHHIHIFNFFLGCWLFFVQRFPPAVTATIWAWVLLILSSRPQLQRLPWEQPHVGLAPAKWWPYTSNRVPSKRIKNVLRIETQHSQLRCVDSLRSRREYCFAFFVFLPQSQQGVIHCGSHPQTDGLLSDYFQSLWMQKCWLQNSILHLVWRFPLYRSFLYIFNEATISCIVVSVYKIFNRQDEQVTCHQIQCLPWNQKCLRNNWESTPSSTLYAGNFQRPSGSRPRRIFWFREQRW